MAVTQKFHAVFNNDWDSLRLTSNVAPISSLPLDNTKKSTASLIVRFETNAVEIVANSDNGLMKLSALGIVGHNFSPGATVRILTYEKLDPVYGVDIPTFNTGSISVGSGIPQWNGTSNTWKDFKWGGDDSDNDDFLPLFTKWIDERDYEAVIIKIDDPGVTRIEIERVILGQSWEPKTNHDWNAVVTLMDVSTHFRPALGNMRTARGGMYRDFKLPFGRLEDDERIELLRRIRKARKSGEILFCLDPTETDKRALNEGSAVVKLKSNLSLSRRSLNRNNSTLTFEEVRAL